MFEAFDPVIVQICPKCLESKGLHEFHKDKKTINGRSRNCRICCNIKQRNYYKNYRNAGAK